MNHFPSFYYVVRLNNKLEIAKSKDELITIIERHDPSNILNSIYTEIIHHDIYKIPDNVIDELYSIDLDQYLDSTYHTFIEPDEPTCPKSQRHNWIEKYSRNHNNCMYKHYRCAYCNINKILDPTPQCHHQDCYTQYPRLSYTAYKGKVRYKNNGYYFIQISKYGNVVRRFNTYTLVCNYFERQYRYVLKHHIQDI